MLGDERVDLAEYLGVPAELELELEAVLECGDTEIFEPGAGRAAQGCSENSASGVPCQSSRAPRRLLRAAAGGRSWAADTSGTNSRKS